jgi:hypothetical protein
MGRGAERVDGGPAERFFSKVRDTFIPLGEIRRERKHRRRYIISLDHGKLMKILSKIGTEATVNEYRVFHPTRFGRESYPVYLADIKKE